MQIQVLIFGQIVEVTRETSLVLNDICDTAALIQKLDTLYPGLSDSNYRIAVNKNIVSTNTFLTDGSTVALLPPFSGG